MSNLSVNSITNAAGGNTATINGMTPTADSLQGFRNRILNGGMVIDQRNNGASVTINGASVYTLDRWRATDVTSGAFTVQQSSVAPSGFNNSSLITVTSAAGSYASTDQADFIQRIEGFNIADFAYGTASATPTTLSFWVRSSVTGSFGGSLQNSDENYSFPFLFTISAANTWEYKTIAVSSATAGTWVTNNGIGLVVRFSLAAGSARLGTAGAWVAADRRGATGQTNLLSTSGATFYITGVQLEAGSVATPFERRPYGTELALCQRYYYKMLAEDADLWFGPSSNQASTTARGLVTFPVTMRVKPTSLEQTGTAANYQITHGGTNTVCSSVPVFNAASIYTALTNFVVASGLTVGQAGFLRSAASGAYLAWSAEL